MKLIGPTPEQLAFMADLKESMRPAIDRHPEITAMEMLAVTSQLVGNLIAMQDQTKVTAAMAMEVVSTNIEIGNREVIDALLKETGGTA